MDINKKRNPCRRVPQSISSVKVVPTFLKYTFPSTKDLIVKSEMECTQILSMLGSAFVRNGKFLAAFFPAACQYPAAIGCCHALAEAVLVLSFSTRRLKCTFHAL